MYIYINICIYNEANYLFQHTFFLAEGEIVQLTW